MFHQSLLSQRQFARLNNIPESTLRLWIKIERNQNQIINMKRSETKKLFQSKDVKRLSTLIRLHPFLSAMKLSFKMHQLVSPNYQRTYCERLYL